MAAEAADWKHEPVLAREPRGTAPIEIGRFSAQCPLGQRDVQIAVPVEVRDPGGKRSLLRHHGAVAGIIPSIAPPVDAGTGFLVSDRREQQVDPTVLIDIGAGAEAAAAGQDLASCGIELPVSITPVDVAGVGPVGVGGVDEYQVRNAVSIEISGLDTGCLRGG